MPLTPHPTPLTAADARHLLRRAGFGSAPARVRALTGLTAAEAARRLLAEAAASTVADPGGVGTAVTNMGTFFNAEREAILQRMTSSPLREKMTLFWHNHFPVEAGVVNSQETLTVNGVSTTYYYTPSFIWTYYRLLRESAFGNLRTLVSAIGKEPAMLRYLNGNVSTGAAPNQNYARELLELFTMGIYDPTGARNYTDTDTHGAASDVSMAARALTGWRERNVVVGGVNAYTREAYFTASRFDAGAKTFLGQTGAWGYDDIVRIVFEQRGAQTARHLARKLLAFFVAPVPDPAAEAALAALYLASGFEMRPVMEALLGSAHFYAPGHRGALVKSPTDLHLGAVVSLMADPGGSSTGWATLRGYTRGNVNVEERSHLYFEPPNVAGWPGHNPPSAAGRENYKVWYAADDFSNVWNALRAIGLNTSSRFPNDPIALVAAVTDAPGDAFAVALALAEHLLAVPLVYASLPDRSATPLAGDPARTPPAWVADAPRYVTDLAKTLLGSVPHYEWTSMPVAMRTTLLRSYIVFLTTEVPEFLLM